MSSIADELDAVGLPTLDRTAWVEVDLDRLEANAAALAGVVSPGALGAVVKADGYGHGLEATARAAVDGGATWLCVATFGEAERLRADGYRGRIFVLYPVPDDRLPAAAVLGVDVSVLSSDQARRLAAAAAGLDGRLRVHVEVDTGMTRGGAAPSAVAEVVDVLGDAVDLVGVWTHLAAPEDPEVNARQLERYRQALATLPDGAAPLRHVAASGGLAAPDVGGFDLVRVGLTLYGYSAMPDGALPADVGPALSVKARPVRVAGAPPGTSVGYGGDWTAGDRSVIATLPLGYADGWSRSTSPGGTVVVAGRRVPIVGRISSDATTVDVTTVPGVDTSTEIVVMGEDDGAAVTADDVAEVRGTISWEVLQQLGARLPRIYHSGGRPIAVRPSHQVTLTTVDPGLTGAYG